MKRIYLDHIAATPLRPEAFEAMRPFLTNAFGNPQSLHASGQEALAAVEAAREEVAALVGASPAEIYFTASGSEANNFAVKGLALGQQARGRHIVVSAIEHNSVLNSVKSLERSGFTATLVCVDREGRVDPAAVEKALTKDTVLVSVMTANSEVGTIEPVAEIAALCRSRNILVHTDAVAAAGNIPVDVKALGVDDLVHGRIAASSARPGARTFEAAAFRAVAGLAFDFCGGSPCSPLSASSHRECSSPPGGGSALGRAGWGAACCFNRRGLQ